MKQPTYRFAVAWIAVNDEPTEELQDIVADQISTCLVADMFGVDAADVAADVLKVRKSFPENEKCK